MSCMSYKETCSAVCSLLLFSLILPLLRVLQFGRYGACYGVSFAICSIKLLDQIYISKMTPKTQIEYNDAMYSQLIRQAMQIADV